MKIALLSNFWYQRGGLERVMFADAAGMIERGHEVAPFASAHPLNGPTPFSQYFPPNVDHGSLGRGQGFASRAATAVRLFSNGQAVSTFERFAAAFSPNVVHQHGVSRQLSPSVLARAHALGIPTILTLHDYSLRCPAGTLSRDGASVCIELSCAGHRYDRAVRFSCVHDSRAASALAAAELLAARALRRYERSVDLFLVPSDYVRDRMAESGLPVGRLRVIANAVEPPSLVTGAPGSYVLAYGRLVRVKGFDLVVDVARKMPHARFVVAGAGSEQGALERQAAALPNIEFVGLVRPSETEGLVRGALAVMVPSEWPEPFGMVVLEAWREGRPVIVTRRGALPEIVDDGRTGIVIDAGDVDGAVAAVRSIVEDPALAAKLGANGRREVETRYSMASHLDRLEMTYRELVG